MMPIPIYQVDAFTDKTFQGNPAAVCLLAEPAKEEWMQAVAGEMNLSETAFLVPNTDGSYNLRWFTPKVEVALCGHATLGSAHTLWSAGLLPPDSPACFHTKSGLLTCTKKGAWIEMDFPARLEQPVEPPPELLPALGVVAVYVGKNVYDYLVEVSGEETVASMAPDHVLLRKLPVRGVMVTSRAASPEYDFVSRFFAPGSGIDEDPVTGSAHCCLGPYWGAKLGKQEMLAYQASPRGGVVRVRLAGERVIVAGQAVTVFEGQLAE